MQAGWQAGRQAVTLTRPRAPGPPPPPPPLPATRAPLRAPSVEEGGIGACPPCTPAVGQHRPGQGVRGRAEAAPTGARPAADASLRKQGPSKGGGSVKRGRAVRGIPEASPTGARSSWHHALPLLNQLAFRRLAAFAFGQPLLNQLAVGDLSRASTRSRQLGP